MNDFQTVLNQVSGAAAAVCGGESGTPPRTGDLRVVPGSERTFADGLGLDKHVLDLLALSPATGWLLWSEALEVITGPRESEEERGLLLGGELHFAATRETPEHSLQVYQSGREWLSRVFERTAATVDDVTGLPSAFIEIREFLPWPQLAELKDHKIRYEVAWRLAPGRKTPCYRPACHRFVGFINSRAHSQP